MISELEFTREDLRRNLERALDSLKDAQKKEDPYNDAKTTIHLLACGTAFRRYANEVQKLLEKDLTAMVEKEEKSGKWGFSPSNETLKFLDFRSN